MLIFDNDTVDKYRFYTNPAVIYIMCIMKFIAPFRSILQPDVTICRCASRTSGSLRRRSLRHRPVSSWCAPVPTHWRFAGGLFQQPTPTCCSCRSTTCRPPRLPPQRAYQPPTHPARRWSRHPPRPQPYNRSHNHRQPSSDRVRQILAH